MPFGRVGLSVPERALPGRYRVRPSREREGDGKIATPKSVSEGPSQYDCPSLTLRVTKNAGASGYLLQTSQLETALVAESTDYRLE